jgi:hypothetical protein
MRLTEKLKQSIIRLSAFTVCFSAVLVGELVGGHWLAFHGMSDRLFFA